MERFGKTEVSKDPQKLEGGWEGDTLATKEKMNKVCEVEETMRSYRSK